MALAKPAGFAFRLLILDAFSPHELQPGRRRLREDWRDIGDVREHASELTCCGEVQNEVAIVQRVAAGDFVGPSFDKIDIGQVFVVVVRTKAEQIDSEVLGRVPIRVYCVGLTGDTQNFAGLIPGRSWENCVRSLASSASDIRNRDCAEALLRRIGETGQQSG